MAAGLNSGDLFWTSPNTFVASSNCGLYCGANVDFVDIDPQTYNMSTSALQNKLIKAEKEGKLPKLIIPVHFSGQSCCIDKIFELSQKYNFSVIEDASHSIGSSYLGEKTGSCKFSDMTVFSFHPVKIITTGEGGMILTDKDDLYQKLIRLRTHGITKNPELMVNNTNAPWYYEQIELGFNYRITDIQAALGLSQMKKLDEFVKRRHFLADRYNKTLNDLPLVLPYQQPEGYSSYHLYVVCLKLDELTKTHRQIFEELRNEGIGVNLHYIPVHTQPYYKNLGFKDGDFPEAEKYYGKAITLPLYYALTEDDQDYVVGKLKKVLI